MEAITYLTFFERRNWRAGIEKFRVRWCIAMHDSLTWPRSGRYRCRTCGRYFPVPWAEASYVSQRTGHRTLDIPERARAAHPAMQFGR